MLETSMKLLQKIESYGFTAYIVGGFVRDYVLGITSSDIDIATNATPKDIRSIFKNSVLPTEAYGSVTVVVKNIHFEITTFRKESNYLNHRRPSDIEYVNDLLEDLKRRDFKINTLCMDSHGRILDLLNGLEDIENKEISTVGDSFSKIYEDSLRILRAIRFATNLNFNLSDDLKNAITKNKESLKSLSYQRKKQELDKIFLSSNASYGVSLLKELGLDEALELYNLNDIKLGQDLLGIWASLKVSSSYPFNKNEIDIIKKVKEVVESSCITNYALYHYGPYVCTLASFLMDRDEKNEIMKSYEELPIYSRKDIAITSYEVMELLNKDGGSYLRKIFLDLENKILDNIIKNEKEVLKEYILNNYS